MPRSPRLAALRPWLPLVVALALMAPTLAGDHYNDDWTQRLMAEGRTPGYDASPHRLFEFTRSRGQAAELLDAGIFPWWSSPDLHLRFFRPLSSLLLAGEHLLFGDRPWIARAHSLAWYAALLLVSRRFYRSVLPAPVASLAFWITALSPHLVTGTVWPAARNGLSAGCVALLALELYARARREGRAPAPFAVAGLFALALCFGEVALGLLPLLCAVELAHEPPAARGLARWRALAPTLALGAAFVPLYAYFGYGAGGSGLYLDPVRELGPALRELPVRLGVLLLDAVLALPAEVYIVAPGARPALALAGYGAFAVCALLAYRALRSREQRAQRRTVAALVAGSVAALGPGLFGILGSRMLSLAHVGFAALLATLWHHAREARARRASRAATVGLVALVLARVVFAGLVFEAQVLQVVRTSRLERRIATNYDVRCPRGADYVLVDGADPTLGMYAAPSLLLLDREFRGTFRMLSMQLEGLRLERTGPRELTLEPRAGSLTSSTFAEVFRSPREGFRAGDELRLRDLTVRVRTVREGRPVRVSFGFARSLDDGSVCLVRWQGERLESFAPPALGATLELPHVRGPLGL